MVYWKKQAGGMDMVTLRKVDLSNIWAVLELSVDETQKSFVAVLDL